MTDPSGRPQSRTHGSGAPIPTGGWLESRTASGPFGLIQTSDEVVTEPRTLQAGAQQGVVALPPMMQIPAMGWMTVSFSRLTS